MKRKVFWLLAYLVTGVGLMVSTLMKGYETLTIAILLPVALFYLFALNSHYKELKK